MVTISRPHRSLKFPRYPGGVYRDPSILFHPHPPPTLPHWDHRDMQDGWRESPREESLQGFMEERKLGVHLILSQFYSLLSLLWRGCGVGARVLALQRKRKRRLCLGQCENIFPSSPSFLKEVENIAFLPQLRGDHVAFRCVLSPTTSWGEPVQFSSVQSLSCVRPFATP